MFCSKLHPRAGRTPRCRPSSMSGVELDPCSSRPEPPSVLRVRADCGGRLFTAKLGVVAHQLLDHLLADEPTCWLVSSATVFATASITSSASAVSTLSEPACPIPCGPKSLSRGGGGRNYSRADETVARSTWRTRCSGDPVSACLPPTPLHRCIGLRVRSLNDPHDARLRPFNRHTLEPAAASRCEPTHPSPSAC